MGWEAVPRWAREGKHGNLGFKKGVGWGSRGGWGGGSTARPVQKHPHPFRILTFLFCVLHLARRLEGATGNGGAVREKERGWGAHRSSHGVKSTEPRTGALTISPLPRWVQTLASSLQTQGHARPEALTVTRTDPPVPRARPQTHTCRQPPRPSSAPTAAHHPTLPPLRHAVTHTRTQSLNAHTLAVLLCFVRINEKSSRALRVISVLGVK